jgi:hypothetical protein
MASLLNLLLDFQNGQGAGSSSYTAYAVHLDSNFTAIQASVNALVAEVSAVQGPNALLPRDILEINDPTHAGGTFASGVIGEHSFESTIGAPTSQLNVVIGSALIGGVRVSNASGATLVGSGGAGTRYVNVSGTGALSLQTAPNAVVGGLDIASWTWSGAAFTGVLTQLARIFFDGDDYDLQRRRLAAIGAPLFPVRDYRAVFIRLEAHERALAGGFTAGSDGEVIGPKGFGGAVGSPGFVPTDGTTWDATTGLYRPGANRIGFTSQGVAAAEFDANGNLDLNANSRVKGVRSTNQSIADATATLVDFDAADAFDNGPWHDHASGTLATRQEFTVPTGDDGTYAVIFDYEWAAPANATDLVIEITVNGTADVSKVEDQIPAGKTRQGQLCVVRDLAAAGVVRARVTQDDTGGAAALNLERASLTIIKLA